MAKGESKMGTSQEFLEMALQSIGCFTDDGKVDAKELGVVLDMAERDGHIDENEVKLLYKLISTIKEQDIDDAMILKLYEISFKLNSGATEH